MLTRSPQRSNGLSSVTRPSKQSLRPPPKETIGGPDICTNAYFRIEPCVSCPIAGYLVISPRISVRSLSELSPDAQASLGPTLAASTRAIETIVRPERVYCLLFAEETQSVHFHLFPRADWLLSRYARVHPNDDRVSGPRLLDWARAAFRSPIRLDYHEITLAILREIRRNI